MWADIVRDKVFVHCNPRSLFQGDGLPKRLMCVNWGWSLEATCIRPASDSACLAFTMDCHSRRELSGRISTPKLGGIN